MHINDVNLEDRWSELGRFVEELETTDPKTTEDFRSARDEIKQRIEKFLEEF